MLAQIKRQVEKNKVDYARESLSKYQLPDTFSPPYDPLVSMGNLNIAKCRVMDSKKVRLLVMPRPLSETTPIHVQTPLWLEFENMDVTNTSKKPIRVIAKHGDDLRQDMLTLQMLALMDKVGVQRVWSVLAIEVYVCA